VTRNSLTLSTKAQRTRLEHALGTASFASQSAQLHCPEQAQQRLVPWPALARATAKHVCFHRSQALLVLERQQPPASSC